ncbi:MAG: hypothetical protein ACTSWK_10145 [Promethearchaeota archaeon]
MSQNTDMIKLDAILQDLSIIVALKNEIYWSVCELVQRRLEKAGSV